jgi:hypothetical protein
LYQSEFGVAGAQEPDVLFGPRSLDDPDGPPSTLVQTLGEVLGENVVEPVRLAGSDADLRRKRLLRGVPEKSANDHDRHRSGRHDEADEFAHGKSHHWWSDLDSAQGVIRRASASIGAEQELRRIIFADFDSQIHQIRRLTSETVLAANDIRLLFQGIPDFSVRGETLFLVVGPGGGVFRRRTDEDGHIGQPLLRLSSFDCRNLAAARFIRQRNGHPDAGSGRPSVKAYLDAAIRPFRNLPGHGTSACLPVEGPRSSRSRCCLRR